MVQNLGGILLHASIIVEIHLPVLNRSAEPEPEVLSVAEQYSLQRLIRYFEFGRGLGTAEGGCENRAM